MPPEPNDRQRLIINIIGTETSEGIGAGELGFGGVRNVISIC